MEKLLLVYKSPCWASTVSSCLLRLLKVKTLCMFFSAWQERLSIIFRARLPVTQEPETRQKKCRLRNSLAGRPGRAGEGCELLRRAVGLQDSSQDHASTKYFVPRRSAWSAKIMLRSTGD